MKYPLVLILLTFALAGAFSQTIEDLDGENWLSWTEQQRYDYTLGYVSSSFFIRVALYELDSAENATDLIYALLAKNDHLDVDELAREITRFYRKPPNRSVVLLSVPYRIESAHYNTPPNRGASHE